ncbi:hypothetical protein V8F06_013370 [Rhypophila decipiens]
MSCGYKPGDAIVGGFDFSFFPASAAQSITCAINHVRPDPGGALLPWLYTLFLLPFHLPASVLRALRWESAQYFALALALFSAVLCVQSYTSTGLAANQVLVWMPLTLIQDVGAMMQMVILIIERDEKHGGARGLARAIGRRLDRVWRAMGFSGGGEELGALQVELRDYPQDEEGHRQAEEAGQDDDDSELLYHALTCLAALVLLVALLVLQIYGIYAAVVSLREATSTDPEDVSASTVKWCSPGFRDFAAAIITGNCDAYEISDASSNGIGCLDLPARDQRSWLKATIGALSASLVFQLADMIIFRCARGKKACGVDMDRPWLTMFAGILMLVVLLVFGVFDASRLPPGITDVVWVYRVPPSASEGTVCRQQLTAPGLRGMIIGYTDGLLGGWGEIFYGTKRSN